MRFQKSRFFRTTASIVLASFAWLAGGGHAWAESRAAERSPAKALARLADDRRLALSSAERDYLRRAASTFASAPPGVDSSSAEAGAASTPAASDPAVEMQDIANELDRLGAGPRRAPGGGPTLADLRARWQRVHQRILDEFAASEARLRAANLPDVIFQRHAAALADYLEEAGAVSRDLEAAGESRLGLRALRAGEAAQRLRKSRNGPPHQRLDPSRLPFRRATPTSREPGAAARPSGPARGAGAAATVIAAAVPLPEELQPTEDAPITPEIQELAASLGNQPLPIFNWVRNNIEFVPTYGSVQGAAMTLDARRGNAFDTASLLIALLRAAGVYARYVTGTVEVPESTVRNWVGGAASANEAQQLMGQGGIPNVGLISGGVLTHIRLDHVWVEAFIDYIPSRGAVHREGDTWVPMDPSFKLHNFTPRSTLFTDNPITALVPSGRLFDFDEGLGKVTNVNEEALSEALQGWVARSDEYVLTNGVERSVRGLVGGPTIRTETRTVFPATLPYRVVARAPGVAALPASLRHYVRLNGYASEFDRAFGDTSFSVRLSLPVLGSRRLGIQFDPATEADAATLEAAREADAPSLPVYLVNVVPVVRLDGVAQATGTPVRMGGFFPIDVILEGPDGPTTVAYTQVAGDEIVVGITGNGVTEAVVEKRFAANPADNAPEYLHQVQLHYWLECDTLGAIVAQSLGVHMLRLPSVGLFNSPLTVSYFFGVPRSGVYESRIMDVKHSLLGAAADDASRVLGFFKQAGTQSSFLEGSVFDQLENRAQPAVRGISAIHLLLMATKQGIPLYHVTSANVAAVLPLLALDGAVKSDISRAVGQGQNVIVSERNLTVGPWRGVGYIVRDEVTGAGGYLISGGLAGGGLIECLLRRLVPVFEIILVILLILLLAFLLALLLAALWEWVPVLALLAAAAAVAPAGAAPAAASPAAAREDIVGLLLFSRGLAPLGVGASPP